jgi:hypothetical protein
MPAGVIGAGQRRLQGIEKWQAKNASHFPTPPAATTAGIKPALPYQEVGGMADEKEVDFCGVDCRGTQAGRGRGTHSGGDSQGGDQRTGVYRSKKQYVGLESDQVREMKQLQD